LLHQASKYLVEYVSKKMGIPAEKAPYEAGGYGNTVSSSIPLLLQKHLAEAVLQRIFLSGFGVGFSWGNNLLQLVGA
jgi:3-oxoacyl-[acyl-carrier-protein] synthase-3